MTRRIRTLETAIDWSWQEDAACKDEDLILFFGPDHERQPEREVREAEAREVCLACPVRRECGDYAVGQPEKYGYWAAMNEDQRHSERRRRMRRASAAA
jgi:WhiB family redox-sensing transcriptional regulator